MAPTSSRLDSLEQQRRGGAIPQYGKCSRGVLLAPLSGCSGAITMARRPAVDKRVAQIEQRKQRKKKKAKVCSGLPTARPIGEPARLRARARWARVRLTYQGPDLVGGMRAEPPRTTLGACFDALTHGVVAAARLCVPISRSGGALSLSLSPLCLLKSQSRSAAEFVTRTSP